MKLLPLENGDRLTRVEFEKRYHEMPRVKKAELIEGIVYMASPLRFESHAQPHAQIMGWLVVYAANTKGVRFGDNATVRLDLDNEVQPDALLRLDEKLGGQSRISEDDYIEGAPELIVEVAASSASYDSREKLQVYRRNQVQEYIIWQVYDQKIHWLRWREGEYISLIPDEKGIVRSEMFPGLWLDVLALIKGDLAQVLEVLQLGLETEAHQDFVKSLLS